MNISTHSPARGLTIAHRDGFHRNLHFNSQPRKGADCKPEESAGKIIISTHSPARGLTAILAKNIA